MTAAPKRRNGSRKLQINWEQIEELKNKASEIGEPPSQEKTPSRKDLVSELAPQLRNAINAGWTYSQLSAWLGERGVPIAPETLQQYMNEASNSKPKSETLTQKTQPHSKIPEDSKSSARFTPKILDDDDL
jgi:IS30 family transposase